MQIDRMIEAEMVKALQERGYIVRHKNEASVVLSWNRTQPMPADVDFNKEALQKIRDQITLDHIEFTTRPDPGGLVQGITSAKLRVAAGAPLHCRCGEMF